MLVEVTSTFNKEIAKLQDKKLLLAIKTALQHIEAADSLTEIPTLKKLQGSSHYYRMRIKDYLMGLFVNNDLVTLVRFLHRKEIYRYFP